MSKISEEEERVNNFQMKLKQKKFNTFISRNFIYDQNKVSFLQYYSQQKFMQLCLSSKLISSLQAVWNQSVRDREFWKLGELETISKNDTYTAEIRFHNLATDRQAKLTGAKGEWMEGFLEKGWIVKLYVAWPGKSSSMYEEIGGVQ